MSAVPRYLTIAECAATLSVDHKTVRRLVDRGALPALRVGRVLRINPADLEALRYRPERPAALRLASPRRRELAGEFARMARKEAG